LKEGLGIINGKINNRGAGDLESGPEESSKALAKNQKLLKRYLGAEQGQIPGEAVTRYTIFIHLVITAFSTFIRADFLNVSPSHSFFSFSPS